MRKTETIAATFFCVIIFLFAYCFCSYAQTYDWINQAGTTSGSNPRIAVDSIGNSYICGGFCDSIICGNQVAGSVGNRDIFLVKYNSQGEPQWIKTAGGEGDDEGESVSVDDVGNIYIAGQIGDSANFGGTIIDSASGFIAKYSATGDLIWVTHFRWTQDNCVVAGKFGKVFITGRMNTDVNVSCGYISIDTLNTIFIACFDSSGICEWAGKFDASLVFDIAVDNSNGVYVTGAFLDDAIFGNHIITSHGEQDIYLAKCDPAGSWVWAKSLGSTDYDQGLAVDVDTFNHVYLTGYFRETLDFGCETLTSTGEADIYISQFDTAGNCKWVRQAGGELANQYAFGLSSNRNGDCFITGSIIGDTQFGDTWIEPLGEKAYLAKYDSSGECTWAVGVDGHSGDRGYDIGTDANNNTYFLGLLFGGSEHIFDNDTLIPHPHNCGLSNSPSYDMFIVKINSLFTSVAALGNPVVNPSIFPNPTSTTITLSLPSNQNGMLSVFNLLGEKVKEEKVIGKEITMDVSSLPQGLYLVRMGNKRLGKFAKK
ncbi:MAG: T9SS type A sorting domain-containing protein [Bacteroidetes bacterium]|nr:T9SS type A sorting domain-containing protein [Bacteroidota bacterium]